MAWIGTPVFNRLSVFKFLLLLGVACSPGLWSCNVGAAPLYKWIDAEGNTHYGERPPADSAQTQDLNSRPSLNVVPSHKGNRLYCGPIRLDTYSAAQPDGRRQLREQVQSWQAQAIRLEQDPMERRYTASLRCAANWGEAQLGGSEAMRKERTEEYMALQQRLEKAKRQQDGCSGGRSGWIQGAEAESIERCYRESTQEIKATRREMRSHDYDKVER